MSLVSLVMPVYNSEAYINDSIESIINQSFNNFELILVDDGSIDKSPEICDEYAKRDKRISVIHKKNEGAGPARNDGINKAISKYIMFPDADDTYEPDMLDIMVSEIQKSDADIAICGYNSYDNDVLVGKTDFQEKFYSTKDDVIKLFAREFPEGSVGFPWNKIYKLDVIKNNNITFPDKRRYQDGFFNIIYFENISSCKIINKCLYNYKVNSLSGIFMKFPKNIFELTYELVLSYNGFLDKYGLEKNIYQDNAVNFFIISTVNCIDTMYSEQWDFSLSEKKQYLRGLSENDYVVYCAENRTRGSIYVRIMSFYLKHKMLSLALITGGIKIFIKKHFWSFIVRLKG